MMHARRACYGCKLARPRRGPHVRRTYLLFTWLALDDPIVDRKPSLSPFSFPYFQAFLQAFLLPETWSQPAGCRTRTSFLLLLYIHSIVSSSDLARIAFLTPYFLVDSKKRRVVFWLVSESGRSDIIRTLFWDGSICLTGLGIWTFGHYLDLILRWVNMSRRPDSQLWQCVSRECDDPTFSRIF